MSKCFIDSVEIEVAASIRFHRLISIFTFVVRQNFDALLDL